QPDRHLYGALVPPCRIVLAQAVLIALAVQHKAQGVRHRNGATTLAGVMVLSGTEALYHTPLYFIACSLLSSMSRRTPSGVGSVVGCQAPGMVVSYLAALSRHRRGATAPNGAMVAAALSLSPSA